MTEKYKSLLMLYNEICKTLTKDINIWKSFLQCACRNYKLRFDEQLLIYFQRPDATAVLNFDDWNKIFGRRINRGAKGIAVFKDITHQRQQLIYYFDILDTHEVEYSRPVPIWKFKSEYESKVIEGLENSFRLSNKKDNIISSITDVAKNSLENMTSNNLKNIVKISDNYDIEQYKNLIIDSVAYMVAKRLDIDVEEYFTNDKFEILSSFTEQSEFNLLGTRINDISKRITNEIYDVIKLLDKTSESNYNKQYKEIERGFENGNVGGREEIGGTESKNIVHMGGGLSSPRFRITRTTRGGDGNILLREEGLHEGASARRILPSPYTRNFGEVSAGSGTQSKGYGGKIGQGDGKGGGSNGGAEGTRPNEVGEADEQYSTLSQRDSDEGGNIRGRIDEETSNIVEQLEFTEKAEVKTTSAFSVSQNAIDSVLMMGTGVKHGKIRVYNQFKNNSSRKENAEFLKKEYGIGGRSDADGNNEYGEMHDSKGLTIKKNNSDIKVKLSWSNVARRIEELIKDDNYLYENEKEYYKAWLEKQSKKVLSEEIYEQLYSTTKNFVLEDILYKNACKNSDKQNAEIECSAAIGRAVENIRNTELLKVYYDENVKDKLKEEIFEETYPTLSIVREQESDNLNLSDEKVDIADNFKTDKMQLNAENFRITDYNLGVGGAKTKCQANIEAIKLLKSLEADKRQALPAEQEILSRYVGWGGLSEVFDETKSNWTSEYQELKNILSEDEYNLARGSTLNAHYTSPTIIKSIYEVFHKLGFSSGNILEPSVGIGNFLGMLPEEMKDSHLYGVELDEISGRIARQLYPKADIEIKGFEKTNYSDNFFDVVIGNVPFGQYKVADRVYDKHNFFIHDYFFAKALDKVRAGGIVAFITSKGTMDKKNPKVRKYLAQRAELLGAIRLPNTAFKENAGTEVTSDIVFLKKRSRPIAVEPSWVYLSENEDGIVMNQYFIEHPEMVLGKMEMVSGAYGMESTCQPNISVTLSEQLAKAIANIEGSIEQIDFDFDNNAVDEDNSVPADPTVRNFSYTILDNKIYFRKDSKMFPKNLSAMEEKRIKGMIKIRDTLRNLIALQRENYTDEEIKAEQEKLNKVYDSFVNEYGLLNSKANSSAFLEDSSQPLMLSLENIDELGKLKRKSDIFYKRTIKPYIPVTSVETSSEALALSIAEKACVDIAYMSELTRKPEEEIYKDLNGVIFINPLFDEQSHIHKKYLTADEYLSGNVREKLVTARKFAELNPDIYKINVEALEKVQPKDLTASEISVRLGATWIPTDIVEDFIFEFFDTSVHGQAIIKVNFSHYTSEWNIENKNYEGTNVKANSTYGTKRINGYSIVEESLNLREVIIYDYIEDENGNRKAIPNKQETAIAQSKQELIRQGFVDWIWKDYERREKLTKLYNEKFNSIRPREYDGSHINFVGMNQEIELKEHQKNAVAHILYGGNTLLAHAVGAGKTFEMVAASQELKRLGLCSKSLFVVPNHLTEQWATEYMSLYPSANILVARKKDFETQNRKKFCSRIATGDYDAVIIGHTQFEKIPISIERHEMVLTQQLDELVNSITELKFSGGEKFTVKQLERAKKSIEQKLQKLNDQSTKDNVITFEELGIDRLFIDESHYYKNLFLYTKMRNVGGIAQTEAKKSSDLFAKCRYLDEITSGRGIVFATGTPISNSMVELYTIQRYLQYAELEKNNLHNFDSWASTFGETVTAIELTPEGTGYRTKTRFAKFYNLPELMSTFKEVADIKTADMLNLPIPKVNYHNISAKPSDIQKDMVKVLAQRAEIVRKGAIDSSKDNMLKITNDGRKLALDQRLINPILPDFEGSKVNICVENVYKIWEENAQEKLTQIIFCDLSTPKNDGTFNIYSDIKTKLIKRGVPEDEIKFIHDADTEAKKKELFQKTRIGEVRILLGSTQKMGAGTNVQDKLIAIHDIDCPWRPSDLEQRAGRIIRQGNKNAEVHIYRYVTEQTFDAYLYQLIEGKQKFASQIMTNKSPVRSADDIDEAVLSYAEIKMLATGNPLIKEKMDLDIQVQKLKLLKANFLSEKYDLENKIIKDYPQQIASLQTLLCCLEKDVETARHHIKSSNEYFEGMKIADRFYYEKTSAGEAIINACKEFKGIESTYLGEYRGFKMEILIEDFNYRLRIIGNTKNDVILGSDINGNITRIDNGIERFSKILEEKKIELENTYKQLETAKKELEKPFAMEVELAEKIKRLDELNILLSLDEKSTKVESTEIQNSEDEEDTSGLDL